MRRFGAYLAVVGLVVGALGLPLDTNGAGSISGTITPPDRCLSVVAVDRFPKSRSKIPKRLAWPTYKGEYDSETGKYTIGNLPDGKYDLIIGVPGGRIEGADLTLEEYERVRSPLTEKDQKQIRDIIKNLPERFCNKWRPLAIDGNHRHAKVLMELIRDRAFHSDRGGEIIWRIEVWKYANMYAAWRQVQRNVKVLRRERFNPGSQFFNLLCVFEPKLGAIGVRGGKNVKGVDYEVPEKFDPGKGAVPKRLQSAE